MKGSFGRPPSTAQPGIFEGFCRLGTGAHDVEFYTALVLQSLGLPPSTFVAMFACGRCAGWCADVIEQHVEDHLICPQSKYIGAARTYDATLI